MVTVDIVARPSAPDAYPVAVNERIHNYRRNAVLNDLASSVNNDQRAQKFLKEEALKFINSLKS